MILTKHINVNNKRLVTEVEQYILGELVECEAEWDDLYIRDCAMQMIDLVLADYQDEGEIDHFKTYSDKRNNTDELEAQDIYGVTVEFQQAHCFNTTKLQYTIGLGVGNS